ncbi:hypothetical protein B6N60_02644 [Richelia sinica FACHB-800]|uniref:Uncharacterized protein n=1 Tax=Richelia sinica FACHB-800 TaxID=1357546 RepID=A0A975T9H8_9NOST|nr:hypothetical protein B6N60_02644 [Richelia sinica FACHB-800]
MFKLISEGGIYHKYQPGFVFYFTFIITYFFANQGYKIV